MPYAQCQFPTPSLHPSLVEKKLPKFVSIGAFFANVAAQWDFMPSHDGSLLAWRAVVLGRESVFIGKTDFKSGRFKVISKLRGLNNPMFWSRYENKLYLVVDGRLWLVDPFSVAKKNWVDVTPRGFDNWTIVRPADAAEGCHVVLTFERDPSAGDLYKVRSDGSGKELIERNSGRTLSWVVGPDGHPSFRLDRDEGDGKILLKREADGSAWVEVERFSSADVFNVDGASPDGSSMTALSNIGRDRVEFDQIELPTKVVTTIVADSSFDVSQAWTFADDNAGADIAVVRGGYPRYVPLSVKGEAFLRLLALEDEPADVKFLQSSPDGRFVTAAVSRSGGPPDYRLFDLEADRIVRLADHPLRPHANRFAATKPVAFAARDGRMIPALLTCPQTDSAEYLPAVVHVHGGPAEVAVWEYDQEIQFLANRGYVVLSVNYRGSTGYGRAFQAAGYRQYGRAMLDDVIDGARWLTEHEIADPKALAIMGSSFGGYTAALAMARDPEIFKAAIIESAMLDVKYQMNNNPAAWSLDLREVRRYYGDPNVAHDMEEMVERSPVTHAERVKGAVLLTAGKGDRIVGVEQTEAFEKALRLHGKNVRAVYFEKEGHTYRHWQTHVCRAKLIEDFLARELGGRRRKLDWASILARYVS